MTMTYSDSDNEKLAKLSLDVRADFKIGQGSSNLLLDIGRLLALRQNQLSYFSHCDRDYLNKKNYILRYQVNNHISEILKQTFGNW